MRRNTPAEAVAALARRNALQRARHAAKRETEAGERKRAGQRARHAAKRETDLAASRAHYAANREKTLDDHARWRAANREEIRAKMRAYRAANRETIRAKGRAYAAANREKQRARSAAWAVANPERRRVNGRVANLRRRGGGRATRADVRELVALPCAYCGEPGPGVIDHVIPVARGGLSDRANLAPACRACNGSKGAREVGEWYAARFGRPWEGIGPGR